MTENIDITGLEFGNGLSATKEWKTFWILKQLDVCPISGISFRSSPFLNFPVSLISVEKDRREEEHVV